MQQKTRLKFFFLLGALFSLNANAVLKDKATQPVFKQGEVVVKLKENSIGGVGISSHDLLWTVGRNLPVTVKPLLSDDRFVTIKVEDPRIDMETALKEIRSNSFVEYAEPNYIYYALKTARSLEAILPNDPSFDKDWGLFNTGQKDSKGQDGKAGSDIGATRAWAFGTGAQDLLVAVIDTGVAFDHEDLKDNIFTNEGEIPDNKIDDDQNGFIDDVHGWNFFAKNNNSFDDNKHGTHCSGTIGAKGNNSVGTAGVNWNVRILPIKFLSATGGGTLADAVESIKYATKMKVKIMSNSWGGGPFSQTMLDAINEARDHGILFVAAAGNDGNDNDVSPTYPGSYKVDNVIAVAATDNRDRISSWSSYGQTVVHLSAPGVNIFSTVPKTPTNTGYDTFSGTSMATPHVAGAAALLWSLNPEWTYTQIKERILATVDPVRILKAKTVSGGRLNIYNAITNTVPVRVTPPDTWKSVDYVVETLHPYTDNYEFTHTIRHAGAKYLRAHVQKMDTEKQYDLFRVTEGSTTELVEEISGVKEDFYTEWVAGEALEIHFKADATVNQWGFYIDKYEYIE